jgi:hypothetical protein
MRIAKSHAANHVRPQVDAAVAFRNALPYAKVAGARRAPDVHAATRRPLTARSEPPTDPSTAQAGPVDMANERSGDAEPAPFDIDDDPSASSGPDHASAPESGPDPPRTSRVTIEDIDEEYEGDQPHETAEERARAKAQEEEDRQEYEGDDEAWWDDVDGRFWQELEADMLRPENEASTSHLYCVSWSRLNTHPYP